MGGSFYPDGFSFETDLVSGAAGAGVVGVLFVIYLLISFVASAVSLASYVLYSLGLYAIADRRGIRHSWLAWIPIGSLWILGSVSDQYQYLVKGKIRSRRKLLLSLSIGIFVVYIAWIVALVSGMIASEGVVAGSAVAGILLIVLGGLVLLALALVLAVYQFVCLNDLYNSCNPNNGVLFLVLSILFSITMPVFVFACRKKDLGMPPRKRPAPEQVVEEVQEEPLQETVEEETIVEKPAVEETVTEEPVTEEGFAQPEEFEEA